MTGSASYINTPSQPGQGHSGAVGGAATGAAAGVSAGMAFGPVGAVVGGIIGGAAGLVSGIFGDKSRVHEKMARKWATMGKDREAAITIRDNLRAFRMSRASALAGISSEAGATQSSTPMGAINSLGSQFAFGQAFTEGQIYIQRKYAKQMQKANDDKASQSMVMGLLSAGTSIAGAFGKAGGFTSSPSTSFGLTSSQSANATFQTNQLGQSFSAGFGN